MAFSALYDANVLYPNALRDVLVRVGLEGLIRAHWTDRILDETFRNLTADRPDLDPARLQETRRLMCAALPDAMVSGYQKLIVGLELPDPDDRHVLAAAIRAGSQVIVTFNLRDFPADRLGVFDIEAKGPDDFLVDQYFLDESAVRGVIRDMARARKKTVATEAGIIDELEHVGALSFAALLRT